MENAAELQAPILAALTPEEIRLIEQARDLADTVLEPRAEAVDNGEISVAENLSALADAGLVAVTTPREYGGHGCSGTFQRVFTEILTAACGTTWFVLTQHLGSCGQIAGSENPLLRERFLTEMAAGRHLVGVGFGHLRRPQPMLTAVETDDGWRLSGVAPWVTGWPWLSGVIFGAALGENQHVYVYTEATESETLISTPPLPLCAMNQSATTQIELRDHFVPRENFVRFSSLAEMRRGDERGIAGAVSPPLGCAVGALKSLRVAAEKKPGIRMIREAAESLEREIRECREYAQLWADSNKESPEYKPNALQARAWAIELALRAAHMAVTAAGGGANARTHPAQRRLREAMFYTLIAQTTDTLTATLQRQTARGGL